mmetsp:Transcript_23267/g.33341  ORF Transcript_23267/g.33341 Transcript_23267/m.33341 type:complete len:321 (-) Transcript_23267:491-1453(-)
MFGSHLVEPYIGELWIANTADTLMKDVMEQSATDTTDEEAAEVMQQKSKLSSEEGEFRQRKREVKCAMNALEKVKPFVDGTLSVEQFAQACQQEATEIVKGSFGDVFATTIGFALQVEAEEFLGFQTSFLGVEGHAARTKKKMNSFNNNWKILGAGVNAARKGQKAVKEIETLQSDGMEEITPELQAELTAKMDESLPAILELAWAINVRDISKTLKEVCKKLFSDASVEAEVRTKRAEGILILGREMYNIGKAAQGDSSSLKIDSEDIKARAAVAAMTTMAKAQGQEVNDADTEEMIKQAKNMSMQQQQQQQDAKNESK